MFKDIKHGKDRVKRTLRNFFGDRGGMLTAPLNPGSSSTTSSTRLPILTVSLVPESHETQYSQPALPACTTPKIAQGAELIVWDGLKTLFGVLSESAGVFAPLKSAVSALIRCVEIHENQASACEGYNKIRIELNNLCQDISGYIGGTVPPSMTPSIANLAREIELEAEQVLQKIHRNMISRITGAMEDEEEILACYRRVQMLLGRLALNMNMNLWKIVDDQATQNRLNRLPYSSAAKYCSIESSGLGRNGCTPNTRVEVLGQMRAWTEDSHGQKIYWLNGMAGTGKTTIAYSLCEQIESAGKLAASFFCSRQMPECRNAGRILPSIAYQLSLFSRPFRHAISDVLERDPDAHNQPPPRQFGNLIATPLREVGRTLPPDLVIVIDALDECDDTDGVDRLLSTLLAHAPNLPFKLFLTSRPNPGILDRMRSEQAELVRLELRLHELERSAVQSDIKTYLMIELERLKLEAADLENIVFRSGVLFVYAATVVRYIKYDNYTRSTQRLREVLSSTASAESSYQEVDALYSAILKAALDDKALNRSEKREMNQVLRTVICAQEPLLVNVVAGFLGLDIEQVCVAMRPLLSVLQVSSTTGLVTTLHVSFPDYLFDEQRSGEYYCDMKEHNAWCAQACFNLIKAPSPPFNICNLESSYLLDRDVFDLDERVRTSVSQHLFYACRYWEAHLELAEMSQELWSKVFDFLSTRLLLWVEIMNLKQDIYNGVGVLSRLHTWLLNVQCSSEIQDLARNAWRFVAAFTSAPLKQSTPHIYISALALWPEHRPISTHYSKYISGLIEPAGTAMYMREAAVLATLSASRIVRCVAYSPDGTRIVSGSHDGTIRIWDAHTMQMLGQPLKGHASIVNSVAYSYDGTSIVSGSADGTIRIWDAHTTKKILLIWPPRDYVNGVNSVAYSPNSAHVVSGSTDKTIRIWDARTGMMIGQPLEGHTGSVNSVTYSPDGARVVSGSDDKTIRIWDARTGKTLGQPLKGHTGSVNSVACSPDGARVVSGSADETIQVWNAHTGETLGRSLEGHTDSVWSVAYSADGAHIISGSWDKTVRIWDAHTWQMLGQPLEGHTDSVWSVACSPDNARIVSGSEDRTIRIWDAQAAKMLGEPPEGHARAVSSVAYSPDGAWIVSGSWDKTIRIWNACTGKMLGQPLEGHTDSVNSVAYSPDGAHIVSGSWDKTIRIWDAYSGKVLGQPLEGHTDGVNSVVYSPDGARIASGSDDKTIRIWDAHTGKALGQPLEGHTRFVNSVAYSSDGTRIVSGSYDNTIRIWDSHTGQMLGQPLTGHTERVYSVSFSPDSARIVSGSWDETIRIWDAYSGKMLKQLLGGHIKSVNSVAYSPDGACIVSGSHDGIIYIYDAFTGQILGQPLEGHRDSVRSVAYSPDGARIVSGSWDNAIRVWDTHACQLLGQPVEGRTDNPNSTPCSPHATRVHESGADPRLPISPYLAEMNPHTAWTLSEDGWVVNHELVRLIWVPPDLRVALMRLQNTLVISGNGSLKLDFSNAKLGEEWRQCYRP